MHYSQLGVREVAEDVLHQDPPLLLTPGVVLHGREGGRERRLAMGIWIQLVFFPFRH